MTFKAWLTLTALILSGLIAAAQTKPISDAEALEAGHRLEDATNSGNYYPIEHFLCVECLLENIRQKSELLKDTVFFRNFAQGFIPSIKYGRDIISGIHGGNYRLMKEYDDKGTKHLVFRLFGDKALNYHDYILTRVGDSIRASDLYPYTLEQWLSGNIARMTDMMSDSSSTLSDVEVVGKMTRLASQRNYTGVKEIYDKVQKKYTYNKAVRLMYVQACQHIDQKLFQSALEGFSADFPGAASSYLMLIDLYDTQKDYEKEFVVLNKLDKLVGGDPVLDVDRGIIYEQQGKNSESLSCYEKVYHYDASIADNSIRLARAYYRAGQKVKAREVLAGYKKTVAYHEGDLDGFYASYPDLK